MKVVYIVTGVLLATVLMAVLASWNRQTSGKDLSVENNQDTTKPKVQQAKENPYEGLRHIAFSITPEKLGISLPTGKTTVYGVVMDWGIDGATATVISFQTGDASFYLSTGGGVIGGGRHKNVNSASKQFVRLAQSFLKKATKTESTGLPVTDQVKFYLLTNNGIYGGQEIMKNFENSSSDWMKLFEEGNKVLSELRKTSENK